MRHTDRAFAGLDPTSFKLASGDKVRVETQPRMGVTLYFSDGGTFELEPPVGSGSDDPQVVYSWWSDAAQIAWDLYSAGKKLVAAFDDVESGQQGADSTCDTHVKVSGDQQGGWSVDINQKCVTK